MSSVWECDSEICNSGRQLRNVFLECTYFGNGIWERILKTYCILAMGKHLRMQFGNVTHFGTGYSERVLATQVGNAILECILGTQFALLSVCYLALRIRFLNAPSSASAALLVVKANKNGTIVGFGCDNTSHNCTILVTLHILAFYVGTHEPSC